jgi:hypothetical protein
MNHDAQPYAQAGLRKSAQPLSSTLGGNNSDGEATETRKMRSLPSACCPEELGSRVP